MIQEVNLWHLFWGHRSNTGGIEVWRNKWTDASVDVGESGSMVGVAPRFAKPHIFPGELTRWGFRMQIVSCNVLHGLSLGGEFFTSSGPSDISTIKLLKKYNYTACYVFSGPITQCSRRNGEKTPSSFCPNTQDHPAAVHRSVNTTSPGLAGVLTGEYCLSFTPPAFSTAAVFSVSAPHIQEMNSKLTAISMLYPSAYTTSTTPT